MPRDRPVRRAARVLGGLVVLGLSLALLLHAGLGVDSWDVLHQGVAGHTGLSIGTVTVLVALAVLVLWIPLRQRLGLGTLLNALLLGPVIDAGLALIPPAPGLIAGAVYLVVAVTGSALGTVLYISGGWGPGARDGLMTGLAARGVPIWAARTAIELTAVAIGWLLGGSVGVGTVVFALAVGPLIGLFTPRLRLRDGAS